MTQALLLIDIQNDYFPGGAMEVEGALDAARAAARLLDAHRRASLPVVHVRHYSVRPGATFLLENTPGSQLHELVGPLPDETVIIKNYPNSFRATELEGRLKALGADSLLICGMMTHMCVDTTTRAAFDLGYRLTVASDACATRALVHGEVRVPAQQVQASYLAALNGVFAKVATVDDLLKAAP